MKREEFSIELWCEEVQDLFKRNEGYGIYATNDTCYEGRLIPICTPAIIRPPALVMGTNHSDFVEGGKGQAREIAESLCEGNSGKRNNLNEGMDRYSKMTRKLCARAGHPVNFRWVATNRCPIQTGPSGIAVFERSAWYQEVSREMDQLHFQLIGELKPMNVIVCGNYAAQLFYGENAQVGKLIPKLFEFEYLSQSEQSVKRAQVNVIPVHHPSRVKYADASVIQKYWVDEVAELSA